MVVFLVTAGVSQSPEGVLAAVVLALLAHLSVFAFAWAYGTSPGKFLLGERVYSTDGQRAGFLRMFLRETIGKWVSGLLFGLGYIWALFDENKQAWHDELLSTVVVHRTAATSQFGEAGHVALPRSPQSISSGEQALASQPVVPPPAQLPARKPVAPASPAANICAGCGGEVQGDWRRCPRCGNIVSTASTAVASLVLVENGRSVSSWSLTQAVTIGRSTECDITLEDPNKTISRKHARVEPRAGEYWLLDLESGNGTVVNGGRVTNHRLVRSTSGRSGCASSQPPVSQHYDLVRAPVLRSADDIHA